MVKKYQGEKPESIKNLVMHVTYLQERVMFHENISKSSSAEHQLQYFVRNWTARITIVVKMKKQRIFFFNVL